MLFKTHQSNDMLGKAVFNDTMTRRYLLSREWSDAPSIHFIMLNPSIGNEEVLETTTKGVLKRAKTWRFGKMYVTNMYSLIDANPNAIRAENMMEPDNIKHILSINATMNVCAWGNHGESGQECILGLLEGRELWCLGLNKNGTPKHPLHLSHSMEPQVWIS